MGDVTLSFFRNPPASVATNPALLSSLQSLESSFFLIALGRYAHALSMCASAFEMCMEGSSVGGGARDGLRDRIRKAQDNSAQVRQLPGASLTKFCQLRNQITHNGFTSKDGSESVVLYLGVGLPLLSASYRDFHGFDLRDALLQEYVKLLDVADRVCRRAMACRAADVSYCLSPFGHIIRWCFKDNFSTGWELDALVEADQTGLKFERMHKEKERLELAFGASWTFDCDLCHDVDSLICELDESELRLRNIVPKRMACTGCGFVVREAHAFLGEELLQGQITNSRTNILTDYGLI